MLRAAVLLWVIAGCAQAPAEWLRDPHRRRRPEPDVAAEAKPKGPAKTEAAKPVAFPRPDIPVDVRLGALGGAMDVHDHLRWPLTANNHPALEPGYPIAAVFAAPGVAWTDLCKLGAQNRRTSGVPLDQIEYLRAWCEVARHDPEAAVVRLAPLLRSTVSAMPAGVRRDIANIVVDTGDAELGQRILAQARVDDVAMYDLISASYEEVGRSSDAMVFNDLAIDTYTMSKAGDHCRRLAKRVVIAGDTAERKVRLEILERAAPTDSTCQSIHHELTCWLGWSCVEYMTDQGIEMRQAKLVEAYLHWPAWPVSPDAWVDYATNVAGLDPTPASDLLAAAALEASTISIACRGERLHKLRASAHDVEITTFDPKILARLDVIVKEPERLCAHEP